MDPAQVVTTVLIIIHGVRARETICPTAFLSSLSVLQEAMGKSGVCVGGELVGAFTFLFIITLFIKTLPILSKFSNTPN